MRAHILAQIVLLAIAARAQAQSPSPSPIREPIESAAAAQRSELHPELTLHGYVELFYQWNFNEPANGVTAFRGYDNRHNSFTIGAAVVDAMGSTSDSMMAS